MTTITDHRDLIKVTDGPPDIQEMMRCMMLQLPIIWVQRSGGELRLPVAEIDSTAGKMVWCQFEVNDEGVNELVLTLVPMERQ